MKFKKTIYIIIALAVMAGAIVLIRDVGFLSLCFSLIGIPLVPTGI